MSGSVDSGSVASERACPAVSFTTSRYVCARVMPGAHFSPRTRRHGCCGRAREHGWGCEGGCSALERAAGAEQRQPLAHAEASAGVDHPAGAPEWQQRAWTNARTRAAQDAKATLKRAEAFSEELAGQLDSLSAMFALVATEPPESER